jgi:hypothetical protein
MRKLGPTVLVLGGLWLVPEGRTQETEPPPGPELDFLEYLGAWAEDDEEWLAIEEWRRDNARDGEKPDEDDGKQESNGDESE